MVEAGSPADRAGLQAGDMVLAVNGAPVSSASELNRQIGTASNILKLEIRRGAQQVAAVLRRS